jgi:hypothetical protein
LKDLTVDARKIKIPLKYIGSKGFTRAKRQDFVKAKINHRIPLQARNF